MCAVIGAITLNGKPFDHDDVQVLIELFRQSKIRGRHATGVSYVSNHEVITIKHPIPGDEFVEKVDLQFELQGRSAMIGHCRYSTSDLEYNQPIADKELSIVHNGVVTQEDPSKWNEHFKMTCISKNDSEIFFNLLKEGKQPFSSLPDASGAVLVLNNKSGLKVFRNGKRPLWKAYNKNIMIFGSTKDILIRTLAQTLRADFYVIPMALGMIEKYSSLEDIQSAREFAGDEWQ